MAKDENESESEEKNPQAKEKSCLEKTNIHIDCPHCHKKIVPEIRTEVSCKTHLIAGVLCLFLCWLCVLFPYCMDSCKSKILVCPNCDGYIGPVGDTMYI